MQRLILSVLTLAALTAGTQAQEASSGGWTSNVSGSAGIGAVTMDGVTYTQISLRPEIPIGKLGIALDLTLYFDEDGGIRKEDWDEGRDIIEKIYYLRWGHRGDPVYLRAGAIDQFTLGYGILVRNYANTMEYPTVKRVGLEWDLRPGRPQIEGFVGNLAELDGPGLVGLRVSYPVLGKLRVGGGLVYDGNMYAGIHDQDDDNVPDELDRYTDRNDLDEYNMWHDIDDQVDDDLWELIHDSPNFPGDAWLAQLPADYGDADQDLLAWTADVGYELLPKLDVYFQTAGFQDYGMGYAPGVVWRPLSWLSAGIEYRIWDEQFIGDFFNSSYDMERVYFTGDTLLTKREKLEEAPARHGYYADLNVNAFNLIQLRAEYNTMRPKDDGYWQEIAVGEGGLESDSVFVEYEDRSSLTAYAGLNVSRIPKLSELSAYYSQTDVDNLFEFRTESTVHGFKVGWEISSGVTLALNWRTSYNDLNGDMEIHGSEERNRTFLVETVFRFGAN